MVTEQAENELICEKLLGWVYEMETTDGARLWRPPGKFPTEPHFKDWAQTGLIVDALQASELTPAIRACAALADELLDGLLTPEKIRAAALAYLTTIGATSTAVSA